jgi:hypothetical protein
MLDEGLTPGEVSILLGISLGTMGNCKMTYESVLPLFGNIKQHKSELKTLIRPDFQRFSASPTIHNAYA